MIQDEVPQYSCVLLGCVGSGKTTLFNKICGQNNRTKYGGASVTQQVFLSKCQYESSFQLLDTPGFGIHDDKYKHAIKQLTGLIALPLNSILLCVRFDRIDFMRDYIKKCIQPLSDHKKLITLIITYWDQSQDQVQDELDLKQKVFSYFEIESYILVSLQTEGEYISEQIKKLMLTTAVQIKMNDQDFIKNFDLVDQNNELETEVYKITKKFEDMSRAVMNKINQILREKQDVEKLDEILHSLSIWIKQQAQTLFENFQKQFGHIMNEQFFKSENAQISYICHTKLQYDIFMKLENITEFIYDKMRLKRNHPLNYIRECNHCGLIWLKVDGCDDITTCGQQLPQTDNIMKAQTNNLKIQIQYKDNQIYLIYIQDEQCKKIQNLIKHKDQLKQEIRQMEAERSNQEQKLDLKRGISLLFSIVTLGVLDFHKAETHGITQQIQNLQEKLQQINSEINHKQADFDNQWNIRNQNQQNLKGCGLQIKWSDLKTPTHLLKQLTQDQILDFIKETQEGVKFSEKFKNDLEQSILDIQKQ